jgi:hypothetical protein
MASICMLCRLSSAVSLLERCTDSLRTTGNDVAANGVSSSQKMKPPVNCIAEKAPLADLMVELQSILLDLRAQSGFSEMTVQAMLLQEECTHFLDSSVEVPSVPWISWSKGVRQALLVSTILNEQAVALSVEGETVVHMWVRKHPLYSRILVPSDTAVSSRKQELTDIMLAAVSNKAIRRLTQLNETGGFRLLTSEFEGRWSLRKDDHRSSVLPITVARLKGLFVSVLSEISHTGNDEKGGKCQALGSDLVSLTFAVVHLMSTAATGRPDDEQRSSFPPELEDYIRVVEDFAFLLNSSAVVNILEWHLRRLCEQSVTNNSSTAETMLTRRHSEYAVGCIRILNVLSCNRLASVAFVQRQLFLTTDLFFVIMRALYSPNQSQLLDLVYGLSYLGMTCFQCNWHDNPPKHSDLLLDVYPLMSIIWQLLSSRRWVYNAWYAPLRHQFGKMLPALQTFFELRCNDFDKQNRSPFICASAGGKTAYSLLVCCKKTFTTDVGDEQQAGLHAYSAGRVIDSNHASLSEPAAWQTIDASALSLNSNPDIIVAMDFDTILRILGVDVITHPSDLTEHLNGVDFTLFEAKLLLLRHGIDMDVLLELFESHIQTTFASSRYSYFIMMGNFVQNCYEQSEAIIGSLRPRSSKPCYQGFVQV